jgi:serine/threonine-protein kinase
VLAVGALATAGLYSAEFAQARRLPVPAAQTATPAKPEGTLTVDSRPEGAQVNVDSIPRGVTPLKLTLPVGNHTLELQNGSATRSIPLAIQAGVVVSQYVDLAPAATPAAVGRLEVTSDPPGARVTVDGIARGVTPVALSNVVPGNHSVAIVGEDSTVTRAVTVSAGSTAAVMVSLTPAGASAGWVAFKVPFEMQLSEGGKLIGTTGTDRLMLPAGRHDLVLSNPAFEFEATLTVQVAAGKTATPTVTIPTGSLSINATPWADVQLDGQAVGTTPLANLSVPVGTHEIVFRHPQLGERRQTVTVKARTPVRVGISFR